MTVRQGNTNRTAEEVLMDLSVKRVPSIEKIRGCDVCGKVLSRYNRHPTKCFIHQRVIRDYGKAWEL